MNQEYFHLELSDFIHLGIPLKNIDRLIQVNAENICLIPGIESFWAGVFNYRSSLVWVLDTKQFFLDSIDRQDSWDKPILLVLHPQIREGSKKQIALIVKNLRGILTVEEEQKNYLQVTDRSSPVIPKICPNMIEEKTYKVYLLQPDLLLDMLAQNSLVSV